MITPLFTGRVLPGGLLVLDRPKDYARHLRSLRGQYVEIIARKRRSKRSLDQNAYWHAVPFPLLAEALGYDSIEELKFDLMGEKWGWLETKAGNRVPVKAHTSQLTTAEGAEFTDWLIRFGATLPTPCIIPLPNEVAA